MKYRKKPVVIEAEQWFPGKEIDGVCGCNYTWNTAEGGSVYKGHHIHTLEGLLYLKEGDYVVGVKGEQYPCKPEIFEMTYEKVEE